MPEGTTYGGREKGFAEAIADQFVERGIGGGGGGAGGATAAKQDEQTSKLNTLTALVNKPSAVNTDIPNPFPISSTVSTIALNNNRKGLTIYNPLSFDIFVGFQATVSSTSYAVKIPFDGYWEAPYGYVGIISIVSAGANSGNINVRELI